MMKVFGVKTPLAKVGDDIRNIIVKSIREEKHELAKREAEYYLDPILQNII